MTISSTNRLASFTGNGSASTFAFAFMVFALTDVLVIETNQTTGAEQTMVLNTDYSVVLNASQGSYPGGTVTLTAGALAAGYTLVITSAVPQTQNTDLTNSGGFYPEVITTAFDRLTALLQQLQQQLNLALAIPIADPAGLTTKLPPAIQRAGMFLTFDASGNTQTNVSVASVAGEVATAVTSAAAAAASAASAATAAASAATAAAASSVSAQTAANAALAAAGYGLTIVPFSATPVFMVSPVAAETFEMELVGNVTSSTLEGAAPGKIVTFILIQDNVGGRTFAWPAWCNNTALVNPAPYSCTVQSFIVRADGNLFPLSGGTYN